MMVPGARGKAKARRGNNKGKAAAASLDWETEVTADSPVGWWKLDEASGDLADSSGNANTLSVLNTLVYQQTALVVGSTYCCQFTAANNPLGRVTLAAATEVNLTSDFTIECWINTTDTSATTLMLGTTDNLLANGYGIRIDNGTIKAIYDGGTVDSIGSSYNDGATHHIVAVYDNTGSNLHLYIDGSLDNSKGSAATVTNPGGWFTVGGHYNEATREYDGYIDEVLVYNTVLSSTRVAAHYSAGSS